MRTTPISERSGFTQAMWDAYVAARVVKIKLPDEDCVVFCSSYKKVVIDEMKQQGFIGE